jgi:hypothetical protein
VGSGEFFGPEDEDAESVQLEAAPNISDLLPDFSSETKAGGPVSENHEGDTSRIFFQEGRADVTPDFVSEMRAACDDFKNVFSDTVRAEPAKIPPFELEVDAAVLKWGRLSARARPQFRIDGRIAGNIRPIAHRRVIWRAAADQRGQGQE